jgi:hypothetical protein
MGLAAELRWRLNYQLKEVMAYLVVIATAALLGVGAFVVYRTLPKQ